MILNTILKIYLRGALITFSICSISNAYFMYDFYKRKNPDIQYLTNPIDILTDYVKATIFPATFLAVSWPLIIPLPENLIQFGGMCGFCLFLMEWSS